MIDNIYDHVEQAQERLPQQYKDKEKIEGVIEAFVDQIQILEDLFLDLVTKRTIDEAEGIQLDRLGDIVGQPRGSLDDDAYRIRIKTRIIQNVSQGEPERLIQVTKNLLAAGLVFYQECYPAGVLVASDVELLSEDQINVLFEQLELVSPAAVRVDHIASFDDTEPFAMDGSLGGAGFGDDLDSGVGGKFAQVYHYTRFGFAFDGDNPTHKGLGTLDDILVGGTMIGV